MARPTVVLFDIDGTLVSCGGAGRRAMRAAFREVCGRDDVCDFEFGGSTDRAIARRGLTNAGLDPDERSMTELIARYLVHLGPSLEASVGYAVLPGVRELLDVLEGEAGLAIGLGTGNVEAGARAKLRRGELDDRFAFGGFGCDHEERAILLEAGARRGAARLGIAREECRVVIVGDTPFDVEAATAISAECVAVSTGTHDVEALRAARPVAVLPDLRAPEVRALVLGR